MSWQDKIRDPDCTLCPLHKDAEYVCLMGTGSRKSDIMIIGEAPGAREDETHQAFVGPAGQLLTELLEEVGISRDDCYITNAVKCRPDGNAQPSRGETKICGSTYLDEEIRRVSPAFVLTLGNTALQAAVGRSGITKYRGKIFKIGDRLILPTFHPAAGLRSPKYLPLLRADFAAFARLHGGGTTGNELSTRVKIIRTLPQLKWALRVLDQTPEVSIDLETTSLEEWHDDTEIVTVGLSFSEGTAVVIPIFHDDTPWSDPSQVLQRIKSHLERHKGLDTHNGKFDARWLAEDGIFIKPAFDTMLAAHVLDENRPKALETLSQIVLGADAYGIDTHNLRHEPIKKVAKYNGIDCDYTRRLAQVFRKQLHEEPRLEKVFYELMMPAQAAITHIERGGVYVDPKRLQARSLEAIEIVERLENYMDKFSGGINYNSPQQVAEWLFGEMKLPIVEATKTGAPSTKESVLFALQDEHKAVRALLKYRKWSKFISTYLNSWSEKIDRRSRLHTNYLLHGTTTFRLSSKNPNLQQVPRDPFIRGILGAPRGWKFVEADYSQIELRIVAMIARETHMLRVLNMGHDLHTETASRLTRKLPADLTPDDRTIWGKHPNFGLCYGMGPGSPDKQGGYHDYVLANGIEISYDDAQRAYTRFHEAYPRLRKWHERQKRLAARYGRVQSAIGRVRHLPDMQSSDKSVRAEAERQAINFPAQSLASDFMLMSLVRLDKTLSPRVARIVTTTHDSLGLEIRDEAVDEVCGVIRETMQDATYAEKVFGAQITVPLLVEIKVGQHWGEGEVWTPTS